MPIPISLPISRIEAWSAYIGTDQAFLLGVQGTANGAAGIKIVVFSHEAHGIMRFFCVLSSLRRRRARRFYAALVKTEDFRESYGWRWSFHYEFFMP